MLPQKWIWLPKAEYPESQTTILNVFSDKSKGNPTVAEFRKEYSFDKKVKSVKLVFSGDTSFRLFCNGAIVATGPVPSGGDFLGEANSKPRPDYYATEAEVFVESKTVEFFAQVHMMPVIMSEYSKGRGGFMLGGEVVFEDGTKTIVTTDSSWQVRKNGAYKGLRECAHDALHVRCEYDSSILPTGYTNAEEIDDIWHAEIAPLKVRDEYIANPEGDGKITLQPHEEKDAVLQMDKIYAGFIKISVKTKGVLLANVFCRELDEETGSEEDFYFDRNCEYRGFKLHSVGNFKVHLKNDSDTESEFEIKLIATNYPVNEIARISTSDSDLNAVLDVCRHTLKICRQLHHLDSPRHCEPLACPGDYYVESLMTMFSFGDMSLSEFDIARIAKLLRYNDGRMFHTSYSLIWVQMLYDVYMITGNDKLLSECRDGLILLLRRFETYVGENGLVETPPDYMFIDWIEIDELSMHHPPKALGQTCMNMFYYGALATAEKIFAALRENAMAEECCEKKKKLRNAINELLFDREREMYFEGLNTPTPQELIGDFMPRNTDKRYYMKHANVLSVYFGICEEKHSKMLVDKIMSDECPGDIQPYFMHYLLEAVFRSGLREEYTLKILEKWKEPTKECSKGLVEGFVKPEPTYIFDHSHAWGGTPLYSLPKALLGLEINEKGLSEITLSPSLLGLESAEVELPTPYGKVICTMKAGEDARITAPDGIKVNVILTDCRVF